MLQLFITVVHCNLRMLYRKPHQKTASKTVKKEVQEAGKRQQQKKFVAKPAPNMSRGPKIAVRQKSTAVNTKNVPQKVQQLQKLVYKIQSTRGNEELQQMLLKQIRGIKSQLREIKTQIGMKGSNSGQHYQEHQQGYYQDHQDNQADSQGQNVMSFNANNDSSQLRELRIANRANNPHKQQNPTNITRPKVKSLQSKPKQKKVLLQVGRIQPYMKQFKIQNTQNKVPQPFYFGYHKKSSKPVIIKYCQESKNMDFVSGMYERLWKNIVKARTICINKIYDLNEPLASNVLVIEQNKCGLQGIQMNPFKISQQVIKALQFFHDCGYLYRNIHPDHVMLNYDKNIVLIDLKKMKKFVDIKGKVIDLRGNEESQELDQFVANSRIKNSLEGRKDDLQCLGYLTLYMLEGKLPWTAQDMVQVRSKLMLNQIFGKYSGLLKFMIEVHKLPTHQTPNYPALSELLSQ